MNNLIEEQKSDNNYTKNFLLYFVFLFIIGNFLIGLLESSYYEYGYVYKVFKNLKNARLSISIELISSSLFLGYSIFSATLSYYKFNKTKYNFIFKIFFIFYYIVFVWIYTFYGYSSPISYLSSFFYNGISNDIWNIDILSHYKDLIV